MASSSASLGLDLASPRVRGSGAELLLSALRAQYRPALFGISAGVAWSVAKLTGPTLVRRGIDLGIRGRDERELLTVVITLLLVGLVQALVYMLLTAVFTLLICSHDEEHRDDHGHAAKH